MAKTSYTERAKRAGDKVDSLFGGREKKVDMNSIQLRILTGTIETIEQLCEEVGGLDEFLKAYKLLEGAKSGKIAKENHKLITQLEENKNIGEILKGSNTVKLVFSMFGRSYEDINDMKAEYSYMNSCGRKWMTGTAKVQVKIGETVVKEMPLNNFTLRSSNEDSIDEGDIMPSYEQDDEGYEYMSIQEGEKTTKLVLTFKNKPISGKLAKYLHEEYEIPCKEFEYCQFRTVGSNIDVTTIDDSVKWSPKKTT